MNFEVMSTALLCSRLAIIYISRTHTLNSTEKYLQGDYAVS